jgi:hypothetical protein
MRARPRDDGEDPPADLDEAEAEGVELVGGGLGGDHPCSEGEPYL